MADRNRFITLTDKHGDIFALDAERIIRIKPMDGFTAVYLELNDNYLHVLESMSNIIAMIRGH